AISPVSSNRMKRLLVVPWSIAPMYRAMRPPRRVASRRSSLTPFSGGGLLAQTKREERAAGGDRHVLAAVDRVRHRPRIDLPAERCPPQQLAALRVEREEVAFAPAAEHEAARRRQHAGPRDVGHAVLPDGIERA